MNGLKTKRRLEMEREWTNIYNDFLKLMKVGGMKMPIYARLSQKYGKHINTIARIVYNMERAAKGGAE